jgi:hypothetical protein
MDKGHPDSKDKLVACDPYPIHPHIEDILFQSIASTGDPGLRQGT